MLQQIEDKPEAQSKLSSKDLDSLRQKATESLYIFSKGILGHDWLLRRIHRPLCEMLQDSNNTRLRIILPRGWLKSTICSISLPLWLAVRDPNVRVLVVQNTFTNACKKLAAIRACVEENALFRTLWPDLLPDKGCTWKTEALCLKRTKAHPESTFEAAGTRTKVTSRHYDVIIEDDTVAPDLDDLSLSNMCPTKEDVDQAIGWHRLVPPLLVNPRSSRNIIVGTRWFLHDLLSWNTDNESQFKGYERSCREGPDGEPDPKGRITYPERFDETDLQGLHDALGSYMFSCLYLNTPVRSEDMTFRQEWFDYYVTEPQHLINYTTVDPGGDPEDTKGNPDYNVVMTTGKDLSSGRIYVLDYFHERCNPGELIGAIFRHYKKWHPVKVVVEGVAYQKSLGYWIRERMRKQAEFFNLEFLTHGKASKGSRIQSLQPIIQTKTLVFRKWMTELVNELTSFPLGAHDDLADALAMQQGMWQVTRKKQINRQGYRPDEVPLEDAIAEIVDRKKHSHQAAPVFDVYDRNGMGSALSWN
jgi:predicted phage terminase large subunit-like protein